jgi:drug/metabolite transporter (DMT)-like permease
MHPSALIASLTAAGLWAASGGGAQSLLKSGMHPIGVMLLRTAAEVAIVVILGAALTLFGKASVFGSVKGIPTGKLTGLGWMTHMPHNTWPVLAMVVTVDIIAYLLYYRLLTNHAGHVVMALTMTAPLILAAYRITQGVAIAAWEWLGLLLIVTGVVVVSITSS